VSRLIFGSPQANRLLQRDKCIAAYIREHGEDPDEQLKGLREDLRHLRSQRQSTTNAEELEALRFDIRRKLEAIWDIEAELGDRLTEPEWMDRS
jgi:hypothetical protein